MKTTEQKLTEQPKSLGRWLMESKRQTQKEMQEAYKKTREFEKFLKD